MVSVTSSTLNGTEYMDNCGFSLDNLLLFQVAGNSFGVNFINAISCNNRNRHLHEDFPQPRQVDHFSNFPVFTSTANYRSL